MQEDNFEDINLQYSLTFDGKGSSLLLQILSTVILSLLTFGIYLPFGLFFNLRWFIKQFSINDKNLELLYDTRKVYSYITGGLVGYILLVRIFFPRIFMQIFFYLTICFKSFEYDYFTMLISSLNILLLNLTLLILILWILPWSRAALIRLVIVNTQCDSVRFKFNKRTSEFGNKLFEIMLTSLIPVVLTLGIYSSWMFVRELKETLKQIRYKDTNLELNVSFTGLRAFALMLKTSFIGSLSLGMAFPWLFISNVREIMDMILFKDASTE